MELMLLTQCDELGKHFAVCEEKTGKCIFSLKLKSVLDNYTIYEICTKNKQISELHIKNANGLNAELGKIGELNLIKLIRGDEAKPIVIYFDNLGNLVKPPIKAGILVGEKNGNHLFISLADEEMEKVKYFYADTEKVYKIKEFAIIDCNGQAKVGQNLIENYGLTEVNISNNNDDILIYTKNKAQQNLVFDLALNLISKKEVQNEKI